MSWYEVGPDSDFPIENLPFGVVVPRGGEPRVVVRIGDAVLDLAAADIAPELTARPTIDALLESGRGGEVRSRAAEVLSGPARAELLHQVAGLEVRLPFTVGDYVDFYSSVHHAANLGRMLRPGGDPILPNWWHLPVGYHGRSRTVQVSGRPVVRPEGLVAEAEGPPQLRPTAALDIELELGFVIGRAGTRLAPDDADRHVFGVVLLNDWSARDIQAFEAQPLGPHLAKSFATTISPWVVTLDALRPHLVAPPAQDPPVAPYLQARRPWGLDIELEVELNGAVISRTNSRAMYWTFAQQMAHMTVNGATTGPGDLFGSGTQSGPEPGERGSLIEITWRGAEPLTLPDGTTRSFLLDGDTVVLRGHAGGDGRPRIGFGEATGTVVPPPTRER